MIIDQMRHWFLKIWVLMIMVVNSIEVTHSFEMNCCNDLYDEAIAVVYVEAE